MLLYGAMMGWREYAIKAIEQGADMTILSLTYNKEIDQIAKEYNAGYDLYSNTDHLFIIYTKDTNFKAHLKLLYSNNEKFLIV